MASADPRLVRVVGPVLEVASDFTKLGTLDFVKRARRISRRAPSGLVSLVWRI
jgi:hypothetical protein